MSLSGDCKKIIEMFLSVLLKQLKIQKLSAKGNVYEQLPRLRVQKHILQISDYSKVTKSHDMNPHLLFCSTFLRIFLCYAQFGCERML